MCYSTALRKSKEEIERKLTAQFNATFDEPEKYSPYYHRNGFTYPSLYIIKMNDTENISAASWGLVPDWAKEDPEGFRKKSNTLNARSETIFKKNSFKRSAIRKRCLILADGFYEPHHENGVPIPYFCYQPSADEPNGSLFLFAGLYNDLGSEGFTTTILTTDANDFFADIHNKKKRMPLVLEADYYLDWLDDGLPEPSVNELMASGFTNKKFEAHPVSRDLYKKGINTNKPYIIEKVEKGTLF